MRPATLHLRSYGAESAKHAHDHAQIVIAVRGALEIDVGGRGARLDASRAAFIAPNVTHDQRALDDNCFLVLDFDPEALGADAMEQLYRQTFLPVSAAVRRLVEFVQLASPTRTTPEAMARHCMPLFIGALGAGVGSASRLEPLLRLIEAAPGESWPVGRMARESGLSASRLHALFRADLDCTPQAWLTEARLRHVEQALETSDTPIAQLALDAGYSDQTALTRAMRRISGTTPAAFRKARRSR
ncbi:AraC family transcriptional regulator [Rhizobacter sp. LjRoot28]